MSVFRQKLYGLEKGGKYKTWEVFVLNHGDESELTICHGQEGGKLTSKTDMFQSGNQGRGHFEQAVFEAQSRIKTQLDKNYRETKEELQDLPVLAMLSKDHTKDGKDSNVEDGVYTSPKLDGVRCLAKCKLVEGIKVVLLESRTGQPYNVPHIVEELLEIMQPGDILDGELYVHGPSLQEISSAVKRVDASEKSEKAIAKFDKHNELPEAKRKADYAAKWDKLHEEMNDAMNIEDIRERLEFHVFDLVVFDTPFEERYHALLEYAAVNFFNEASARIVLVDYRYVESIDDLNFYLKRYIDRGYEGIMYRTKGGEYESGKRSAGLWKYKLFFDEEFEITGAHEDKQGYIVFELKNNLNDLTFDCVMGDYAFRLKAAQEKELYIRSWMTVQFQSRYKGTLLPQFPTGKLIREGKVINGKFVPSE